MAGSAEDVGSDGVNSKRIQFYCSGATPDENTKTDSYAVERDSDLANEYEQSAAASLVAGGEEYMVTEQEIKSTFDCDLKAYPGPPQLAKFW